MKICKATNGIEFMVDDEDYEFVCNHNWTMHSRGCLITKINGKTLQLHRLLLSCPRNRLVDHIDHNQQNNKKSNLRICTKEENGMNRLPSIAGTSKYKGVYWNKKDKKWQAQLQFYGIKIYLGQFIIEQDAAIAYNKKAIELFGEFALLNGV